MLSIGELAHRTGVSRRMLRHWETVGLLSPAEVDQWTGRRRYAPHQVGRVQAIAGLRAVGFGLDTIGDLLAEGLSEQRLVELLRAREAELTEQITEASRCLSEVRARLGAIEEGHRTIMETLQLTALPALKLLGAQEIVTDESEIGAAVGQLVGSLRERVPGDRDLVLTYDGTSDPESIMVTAGIVHEPEPAPVAGLEVIEIAGSEQGAAVHYPQAPVNIGDAWMTLDTALERYALRTSGVYRQLVAREGAVTLQAPVVGRDACER
ncbi:DNA-binding transcriptional regulator, MerR family [Microlunatus soli]|uniref:DNA-binding transcriptional regulator, MerR family n=2 Tax=Microlunatus soli TaxID=630515 RepID=A0A1H1QZN5_9ACTN|nr:DNA-binding transcriptional regulator, MerR family [Microlunatus soli]